jgi:hypothetical protein
LNCHLYSVPPVNRTGEKTLRPSSSVIFKNTPSRRTPIVGLALRVA